ncbi:hypothetical protein QFZ60_003079 [Arthrobacter sp. B2I5]|uniref:hypothetical protein n=1 Tax=Arthrobacter sp. B2I5 TaxID=3042266 RepID=UPI002783B3EA|nr:hypothetical protein [Arthrobacter sp. B2I5]MDQ0826906.1 hypothetical protein [Arthrobacter sp. B2I5]
MSEILLKDPRTAWAWHEYNQSRHARQIPDKLAKNILDAIPAGDHGHVEVLADGDIWVESSVFGAKDRSLRRADANFLARTMRRWIMVTPQLDLAVIVDGPPSGGVSLGSAQIDLEQSWITTIKDNSIKVFLDKRDSPALERIKDGAGFEILRLPYVDDVPEAPKLTVSPMDDTPRQLGTSSNEQEKGQEAEVAAYMAQVVQRVQLAFNNYGSKGAIKWIAQEEAARKEVARRALGYLLNAEHKLKRAPQIGDASLRSVLNYYHHMELLAAVCCREMGYPYPGNSPLGQKVMSLDDFY